jgi:hypothetical protein
MGAVSVGLPLLEAMGNGSSTQSFPSRFVLWFWGNGITPDWAPTATGPQWEPTPVLAGLMPVKGDVHLVSGTTLPTRFALQTMMPRPNNPHVEGACGMLAGGNPVINPGLGTQTNDWDYMTAPGPSLDELAADVVGVSRFRSQVWAVSELHGVATTGTAVRYISHRAPNAFNTPNYSPAQVFAQLFGARTPDPLTASILDAVVDESRSLRLKLSAADRLRLDRHLSSVRELEMRVRSGNTLRCTVAAAAVDGAAGAYRLRARAFADLAAMAFACDLTRVVSLCFSSPASHVEYPDVFGPNDLMVNNARTSFHEYEHSKGVDATVRRGLAYFVECFGEFIAALKSVPEGAGTVLDHSVVLGTSELGNGATHGFTEFPLFIAGGGNGRLRRPGTHVRLPGANATRAALTCLRALGDTRASFGTEQFATSAPIDALLT